MFKKYKKLLIAFLSIFILICFAIAGLLWFINYPNNLWQRHKYFLYKTDFYELRNACIDVIKNRHSYKRLTGSESPDDPEGPFIIDPTDKSIPKPLQNIHSTCIVVTKCRLVAHFHHGPPVCSHLGFTVFWDENNITDSKCSENDQYLIVGRFDSDNVLLLPNNKYWIKVIPNLWYFDCGFAGRGECGQTSKEVDDILRQQVDKQRIKHNE
jgi:hypothetical protein